MTNKQATELLYTVLNLMAQDLSREQRHELQRIGESLLGEYKDLNEEEVREQLKKI